MRLGKKASKNTQNETRGEKNPKAEEKEVGTMSDQKR